MSTKSAPSSRSWSNTPNLDSGMLGLETTAISDIISAKGMSSTIGERARPQVPQKGTNLDEIFRLRKELDEARKQKREAEDITDMMAQDLDTAQEEVKQKNDESRRIQTNLLKCEDELKIWREKAQSLSTEIREDKRLAGKAEKSKDVQKAEEELLLRLRGHVADLTASLARIEAEKEAEKKRIQSQTENELTQLHEQVSLLTASLTEEEGKKRATAERTETEFKSLYGQIAQLETDLRGRNAEVTTTVSLATEATHDKWQAVLQDKQLQFEAQLKESEARMSAQLAREYELRQKAETTLREVRDRSEKNLSREQKLRYGTEERLQTTIDKYEAQARDFDARMGAHTAELQQRAEKAEASLQEHASRMQTGVDHEKLLRAREAEVEEQRRRCQWFKGVSERLSREVKEAQAACRGLEQSEQTMTRQLNDLRSQVNTLQHSLRVKEMPGTY